MTWQLNSERALLKASVTCTAHCQGTVNLIITYVGVSKECAVLSSPVETKWRVFVSDTCYYFSTIHEYSKFLKFTFVLNHFWISSIFKRKCNRYHNVLYNRYHMWMRVCVSLCVCVLAVIHGKWYWTGGWEAQVLSEVLWALTVHSRSFSPPASRSTSLPGTLFSSFPPWCSFFCW